MTNDSVSHHPVPGWYSDPESAERLRYWDGSQWTAHVAAPQPTPPAAPSPPLPPAGYRPPPAHVTLYNNPYRKPPRAKRASAEDSLPLGARIQAAALDASLVVPFIILGFVWGPLLGWVAGDAAAGHHAYHAAGIVLAVGIGGGLVIWNLLIRERTLGTDVVLRAKDQAP